MSRRRENDDRNIKPHVVASVQNLNTRASVSPVSGTGVKALIDELVDDGTFSEWSPGDLGVDVDSAPRLAGYLDEFANAQERTGRNEAVTVGTGEIDGQRAALIVGDFSFLAGSVGRAACQIVIAAFERARELGLPVLATPSSGGTRMQEGTAAFVLMADVAAAARRFRVAGNALIVWLRNPTTGGVMATWGSLGSMTFGEPGALTGFLGPRVFEELTGDRFPPDVQTPENLAEHGVIDGVVSFEELRAIVTRILCVVIADEATGQSGGVAVGARLKLSTATPDPWECVERTRDASRPTTKALLAANLTHVTSLSGTTQGERSDAVLLCLAKWLGSSVVVVAQDRAAQSQGSLLNPAALRTARRGFALAAELGLPVISIVDTAGAELSVAAEQAALAGEIARCLADLTELSVATVSVLLGMGCGGGALAMLPADRVVSAEHGWVAPLPLEGASIIRFRTPDHAAEMARSQEIAAWQLATKGIVDVIVSEEGMTGAAPDEFLSRLGVAVSDELTTLLALDSDERTAARELRYDGGLARG